MDAVHGASKKEPPPGENCRHAGRLPIAQRPNSTLLSPPAEFPDAKRKEPPGAGTASVQHAIRAAVLSAQAGSAPRAALVDLHPRQAPAPKVDSRRGALHSTDAPEPQSGIGATNSLPIPEDA